MAVPGTQGALPVARESPRTQSNLLIHTPSQALGLDTKEDGQGGGMVTHRNALSIHSVIGQQRQPRGHSTLSGVLENFYKLTV